MTGSDRIIDEAAVWQAASAGDAMDWDGFTAWLEADARQRDAFHELELAGGVIAAHAAVLGSNDHRDSNAAPRRWRPFALSAVAAALVAAIALPLALRGGEAIYQSGASARIVSLDDGSVVVLAPNSRLSVDGQQIALSGGAYFDVRHDPGRALNINAGPVVISDIGTRFDVQAGLAGVRIGVAEGKVSVASAGLTVPVELTAGRELAYQAAPGIAETRAVSPAAVAGWRTGQLNYADTPLPLVAAELARYGGITIAVSQDLQDRRFSGTLALGDGQSALRDLAQLMELEVGGSGGSLRLDRRRPGTGSPR